ncbi:uncharacterized protein [Montipora foliosa]|uniref:uncharacterized protein isoform X2 n=1 Tax=Montipora foliosa TaxID=591990 RepID=UPI0035F1E132
MIKQNERKFVLLVKIIQRRFDCLIAIGTAFDSRLFKDTSDKIETWDDLLDARDKPSSNNHPPFLGIGKSGGTRTSFVHPGKMALSGARVRRYGVLQALAHQNQNFGNCEHAPIWHQVATSEKSAKESGNISGFQKKRVKRSSSKVESSLTQMISGGFADIQAKSAERVKEKLNKITRKERETFMKKFMAFKPSSLYKVDLMRVQQAGREVSEECAREDVKPASWYGDLEQEALDLGITSELEVTVWFEKLCLFSIDDVTTIPFVQAKLCLVVQSLPVYELCSLTMMDVLKFLVTKILNSSITAFNDWINHRKLLPRDNLPS